MVDHRLAGGGFIIDEVVDGPGGRGLGDRYRPGLWVMSSRWTRQKTWPGWTMRRAVPSRHPVQRRAARAIDAGQPEDADGQAHALADLEPVPRLRRDAPGSSVRFGRCRGLCLYRPSGLGSGRHRRRWWTDTQSSRDRPGPGQGRGYGGQARTAEGCRWRGDQNGAGLAKGIGHGCVIIGVDGPEAKGGGRRPALLRGPGGGCDRPALVGHQPGESLR